MGWEPSFFIIFLSMFTLMTVVMAIISWRRRPAPGSLYFSLLMLLIGYWFFTGGLAIASPDLDTKIFWMRWMYLAVVLVAPAWLATILAFLRDFLKIPPRWVHAIWFLPLVGWVTILTNDLHHLFWVQVVGAASAWVFPGPLPRFTWGIGYWLIAIYSHLLSFMGVVLLLRSFWKLPPYQKHQAQGLVFGWVLPWAANLVYGAGWAVYPSFDPTPLMFIFTIAVYFWCLVKLSLFAPSRAAAKAVMANIGDGYIVLDIRDRVVDVNEQARMFLGVEPVQIGQPVHQLLHHRPDVLNLLRGTLFLQVDLPSGEQRPRFLEATLVPWYENERDLNGRILILHDITHRKMLELRLQTHLTQQTFTSNLLQLLFRPSDRVSALNLALERIGRFARVDRVFLGKDSVDHQTVSAVATWNDPASAVPLPLGPLLTYENLPGWNSEMEANGAVISVFSPGYPEELISFMRGRSTFSMAAFPVFDHQGTYGFVLLESVTSLRIWTVDDLELLKNAARIVSSAVARWGFEDAERRQRDLAEALRDMAGALNSTLNLDEVLDRALANLEQVVPYDAASFALLEGDRDVRFVRFRGMDIDQVIKPGETVRVERIKPFDSMIDTHRPVILMDAQESDLWVTIQGNEWVRSYLGVPIQSKGRIAGFINLFSRQPGFFTPDHVDRMRAVADDVALAIENARLYDETRSRAEEMEILYQIGLILTSGLEMKQVLAGLLEECLQVLPIDVFYVALYDEENGMIDHPMFWERGALLQVPSRSIHTSAGLSGHIILTREALYLPDTMAPEVSQRFQIIRSGGVPSRSYVGVPLLARDQVVGVLSMQNYQPGAYTADQVRLLQTIGTQAAVAVENARVFEQMRQIAITDAVTLLYTRRHFTELGQAEVSRALRYDHELSILLVDIDRFKRVNDTWGHNVGDLVLQAVAQQCRQSLRQSDLLGRWGGEEFGIVLPETGQVMAVATAERIRETIEQTEIPVPQGVVHVSVSIGVTSMSESCGTLEGMINCADQALYAAKQAGRNQVKVWQERME